MSKRKKKKKHVQQEGHRERGGEKSPPVPEKDAISSCGKKTIGAGIALLVIGFIILTFTDPEGKNWASTLSPFLILGAYAVIALGIFIPEHCSCCEKTPQEDPAQTSLPS